MVKSTFSKLIYYLSLSFYSIVLKYVTIKSTLDTYDQGTGFMGMYKTNSSESINYINLFILSFICIFLIDFIYNVILFYANDMKYKELFLKTSNYLTLILFIMTSIGMLFVSEILSFIVFLIGISIHSFLIGKNVNKKSMIITFILCVVVVIALYLIINMN